MFYYSARCQRATVPTGDPRQRYRKEVARFIRRGEISIVGRGFLDVLRTRLNLDAADAKVLEEEILDPYRQAFREKLQQYEQVVTQLLQQHDTISEADRSELQALQQALELRDKDTIPIESRIAAALKAYKQKLQAYEQSLTEALRQEWPLSEAKQQQIQKWQQQMELSEADAAAITARVTADAQAYHHHVGQYEQAFAKAIQQEYPLSEARLRELRQYRESLNLAEVDVAPIEAKITTEFQTYHQKLQQYEQAYSDATQRKHYPNETIRQQLQKTWQALGLHGADVKAIEYRLNSEIQIYQDHLNQYQQDFIKAVQQHYPLEKTARQELDQRQAQLGLTGEDVASLETSISKKTEERLARIIHKKGRTSFNSLI